MRPTAVFLIIGILLAASAASAETVYLEGGGSLEGEILELSDKTLVMTIDGVEGSKVELPLSRVSAFSLYELKRVRIDRSSPSDLERLGDWAMGRGLLSFAMDEYGLAVELAADNATPELRKKLEAASSKCGADKLARGRKLMTAGELEEARSFFKDILKNHPTCPAAKAAEEQVIVLDDQIRKAREAAREIARTSESTGRVESLLAAVKEQIAKGNSLRRLGFGESGSLGRAENAFLAAIEAYQRARGIIVRARKLPGARAAETELRAVESTLRARLVDVYVDIGHNFIVKGNLIRANHYMGLALAIDPNNPKALALRGSIASATADDAWGRSGR